MTPADQQEPSMEEILASIRRIIAETGEGDVRSSAPTNPANMATSSPEVEPERILELTEVVGKASAPVNKAASQPQQSSRPAHPSSVPQPQASPSPAQSPPPSPRQIQAVSQQSRPQQLARSQPVAQVVGRPNETLPPELKIQDDYLKREIAELSFPAASPSIPSKTQVSRVSDQSVALISNETALAASAAFAELTAVSNKLPMGSANRTLEDLTKDLLRPLLKSWLDQNLPPLVQRLIRDEIERVTGHRS